ncbi:MAG: DUF4231 domain-containing protein [Snowella sp.]|nr:DUF4231 domain-containing protein [Snowella sp.]
MPEENSKTDALDYGNKKIKNYRRDAIFHRNAYFTSQIAAVFLSGITPILIIWNVPEPVKAAAPALASIAGGLSMYRWRENWIRCEITAEKMNDELIKFKLVTAEYKDETAASEIFVTKIGEINDAHLRKWRTENEVDMGKREQGSSRGEKDPNG